MGAKKKLKVLLAGAFNSGKTTFVKTVNSECFDGVEVPNFNSDTLEEVGGTTTVGLDISHIKVEDAEFIFIGLPGQKRFSFLWDTFGNDFDIIIFVHSAELPTEDVRFFIDYFSKTEVWEKAKKLIVLTKTDIYPDFDKSKLLSFGIPVITCDPRKKSEVSSVLKFIYNVSI